ncbi:MAG TPA: phosphatase PAP2 family protein [Chloroflexota bacterium]|nr:phosphatase PAP2 family protein [Chloroflexota bacterium]
MTQPGTYRRWMPLILAAYIVAVAAAFLFFNARLTVEWVAIVLFGAALLSGRAVLFIRDWGVFFVVLVAWQLVSPVATIFHFPWHVQPMITADRALFFGHVPAVWLQAHLYQPGRIEPWDILSAVMYMLHFLAPLVAGFALWLSDRAVFRQYAITFVLVAVAGFATYILYPAVPPWMAGEKLLSLHGQYLFAQNAQDLQQLRAAGIAHPWQYIQSHGHVYLPGARNIFNAIMSNWYNPYNGEIFPFFKVLHMHYDQVGAMPSEHAAYPMLFFLFLRRQFGRTGYIALVYIALITFAIVYLGQHYVVDALVGFAYAGLGYLLVTRLYPALRDRITARPAAEAIETRELETAAR